MNIALTADTLNTEGQKILAAVAGQVYALALKFPPFHDPPGLRYNKNRSDIWEQFMRKSC
jgi:hypothetical protein